MGNRSIRDERQAYSNPNQAPGKSTATRPKAGPADPATRRKLLNQRLSEREASPPKPKPARAAPKRTTVFEAAAELKNRGRKINRAIDDAT